MAKQLSAAPQGVKTYEQGRWPGVVLSPWTEEADAILRQLLPRTLTEAEIEAVRRVHCYLLDEGPRPTIRAHSETVEAPRPDRLGALGIDPADLGE